MIIDTDEDHRFNPDTCYIWRRGYKTISALWLWRVNLAGGEAHNKECAIFYELMWYEYFTENPDLQDLLYSTGGDIMLIGSVREYGASPVDSIKSYYLAYSHVRNGDEIRALL